MNQTIHIFKKDVRRFSWEIALSLILLVFYAWSQPVIWNPVDVFFLNQGNYWRYLGANLCGFLLILAWSALLIRVISEDSPTGDLQFWITRPYRWPNLLAAKVLFFVAIVHAPLFAVQLGLLQAAGFPPLHYLSKLWHMHLFLAACYLCLAGLTVVARGGRQFARAVIVLLIFLVGLLWIGSTKDSLGIDIHWHNTYLSWIAGVLLFGLPIVVIVRQYARRKTAQSRWILFAGGLALLLLTAAQPSSKLNEAAYPLQGPGAEPQWRLSLEEVRLAGRPAGSLNIDKAKGDTVLVNLPLSAPYAPDGYVIQMNAMNITLQAADGTRWSSGWKNAYHLFADDSETPALQKLTRSLSAPIEVDRSFFDHVKDAPVTLHIATAATLFRDEADPEVTPVKGQLAIPGVGFCVISETSSEHLTCRTAQSLRPMMGISRSLYKSCPPSEGHLAESISQYSGWFGNTGWEPELGLSPIETFSFYFNDNNPGNALMGCFSESFTLHRAKLVRKFRMENDFSGVKLID